MKPRQDFELELCIDNKELICKQKLLFIEPTEESMTMLRMRNEQLVRFFIDNRKDLRSQIKLRFKLEAVNGSFYWT